MEGSLGEIQGVGASDDKLTMVFEPDRMVDFHHESCFSALPKNCSSAKARRIIEKGGADVARLKDVAGLWLVYDTITLDGRICSGLKQCAAWVLERQSRKRLKEHGWHITETYHRITGVPCFELTRYSGQAVSEFTLYRALHAAERDLLPNE